MRFRCHHCQSHNTANAYIVNTNSSLDDDYSGDFVKFGQNAHVTIMHSQFVHMQGRLPAQWGAVAAYKAETSESNRTAYHARLPSYFCNSESRPSFRRAKPYTPCPFPTSIFKIVL